MRRHLTMRILSTLVLAGMLLAGLVSCGGSEGSTTTTGASGGTALPATTNESGSSNLPAASVTDLATGETVDFSTIAPNDRSILLWFYAPH